MNRSEKFTSCHWCALRMSPSIFSFPCSGRHLLFPYYLKNLKFRFFSHAKMWRGANFYFWGPSPPKVLSFAPTTYKFLLKIFSNYQIFEWYSKINIRVSCRFQLKVSSHNCGDFGWPVVVFEFEIEAFVSGLLELISDVYVAGYRTIEHQNIPGYVAVKFVRLKMQVDVTLRRSFFFDPLVSSWNVVYKLFG